MDVSAAERGNASAWLGKYGVARGGSRAVSRATDGEAAGVDAEYQGRRDSEGAAPRSAGDGAADGRRVQLFWGASATTGTEMGRTADAGQGKTSRPQAADAGRAGCVSEFRERQSARSDRICRAACGSGGGNESCADAKKRRRMEIAVRSRCKAVSFSRTAKAA